MFDIHMLFDTAVRSLVHETANKANKAFERQFCAVCRLGHTYAIRCSRILDGTIEKRTIVEAVCLGYVYDLAQGQASMMMIGIWLNGISDMATSIYNDVLWSGHA